MVSLKLTTTIATMLATLTVAAPFPGPGPDPAPAPVSTSTSTSTSISTSTATKPFSFSKWVDDILNPNVVALTPEQALEAYYQSINGTSTSSTTTGTELSKRAGATCEPSNSKRMPVADAVYIVNKMAAGGQKPVHMPPPFCSESICRSTSGRSAMVGQKDCNLYVEEPSEYWARAGGLIMDACTWGDMSGGKIIMPANSYITVLLWGQGH
ncbi:uncharacterized protein B0T23DRAFT_45803 [Neurospora hispaniola]|uniref:Ecp2 effector protein domain-containing protein n=1 Tax=Neurospora hispaniola TaxID=588809 RepID=A0AAJ0HZ34_9PEZI|nr:hypothetical protein B0T23DRAFT_45803 [Neurospora hispaniola]